MKSKRIPPTRPILPVESPDFDQTGDRSAEHPYAAPVAQGQLRRVLASEVPPPRPVHRPAASLRSRAGSIPGGSRSGRPPVPGGHAGPGVPGGPGIPGGSGGPGGYGPDGPDGPGGFGPGGTGGSARPGPGKPGDPRRRRRHRALKITLAVVAILLVGILVSAYLVWNSLMDNVNIVSPTDMTVPSEYNVPTESLSNPVPEERGIVNILLLGADAREEDVIQSNTDSMMILTIDQGSKKIKITSLQRDMLVWMPGRSEPAKLNAANAYGGPGLATRVVNDTFRLNIENYVVVNMRGMEALIDIAGGVSVDVEKDELYYVNQMIGYQNSIYPETKPSIKLTKSGMQLLDGRQAVAFGRIRKGDSDYARMGRQRVVVQALFDRFMQAGIGTKTSMISKGLSYITTNFSKTQLTSFGLSSLPLMSGTMEQLQIPINGFFVEDPEPVWVNRCDFNGMIPLLQQFIFGRTYPFDPVKRIPGAPITGSKATTATTRETTRSTTTVRPSTTAKASTESATQATSARTSGTAITATGTTASASGTTTGSAATSSGTTTGSAVTTSGTTADKPATTTRASDAAPAATTTGQAGDGSGVKPAVDGSEPELAAQAFNGGGRVTASAGQ